MSQPLECPRCQRRGTSDSGWRGRSCPACGTPMVLAQAPAETLVRRYLHGDRLLPLRFRRSVPR